MSSRAKPAVPLPVALLRHAPRLERVEMQEGNGLSRGAGAEVVTAVSTALSHLAALRKLSFPGDNRTQLTISESFPSLAPTLEELEISELMGSKAGRTFATNLAHLTTLRRLQLNSLDVPALKQLVSVLPRLHQLHHLHHLELHGFDAIPATLVGKAVVSLPHLETLEVIFVHLSEGRLSQFFPGEGPLRTLRTLRLMYAYDDEGMMPLEAAAGEGFAAQISRFPQLRTLDIQEFGVDAEEANRIVAQLVHTPLLEELTLHTLAYAETEASTALGTAVTALPHLRKLDVSGMCLGDEGAVALGAALAHTPRLEVLHVIDPTIAGFPFELDDSADADADAEAESTSSGESASSTDGPNDAGSTSSRGSAGSADDSTDAESTRSGGLAGDANGTAALIAGLQHLPALHTLHLSVDELGVDLGLPGLDLELLGEQLQYLPSLRDVTVVGFGGDVGAFCAGLVHVPLLRSLRLRNSDAGDELAEGLATAHPPLPMLQKLFLENVVLTDGGMASLAAALPHMSALEVLDVSNNPFTDEGAGVLAVAFTHLPALRDVKVKNEEVTETGQLAWWHALRGRGVRISVTPIGVSFGEAWMDGTMENP